MFLAELKYTEKFVWTFVKSRVFINSKIKYAFFGLFAVIVVLLTTLGINMATLTGDNRYLFGAVGVCAILIAYVLIMYVILKKNAEKLYTSLQSHAGLEAAFDKDVILIREGKKPLRATYWADTDSITLTDNGVFFIDGDGEVFLMIDFDNLKVGDKDEFTAFLEERKRELTATKATKEAEKKKRDKEK
ncbi:MAG: hypothetical protein LBN40_05435 [Oscillospiraceae bacterium]|jgi:hypothetical protein|nr:hypothetical protein [Oscillospiraceae bacterium]